MTYGADFLEGGQRLAWVDVPVQNCQLDIHYLKRQRGDGRSGCKEEPCFTGRRSTCDRLGPDQGQLNGSKP
jgi:hypothetical protein